MRGRRDYAPVSPLIHTIWSYREDVLTLRKQASLQCMRKRLESDHQCLDDRNFASKRTRFNEDGQRDSDDNGGGPAAAAAGPAIVEVYSQKCHDRHDDSVEQAQALLAMAQDKRTFRFANMYGYYCRGNRRLRRMLSSLAQSVVEKNFYSTLQTALNDHYIREAELQKIAADATMFVSTPVLNVPSDQFSTDTMDGSWYCPPSGQEANVSHQFISTEQLLGPGGGAWNVAAHTSSHGAAQFVSEETDLMDISRNTVSGGSTTGLDWGASSFTGTSPPPQALLVVDTNCYGDETCQDSLDLDHICIYDHGDLAGHGYCPNQAGEGDVLAVADVERCWQTVGHPGEAQPILERPLAWREDPVPTVDTFDRNENTREQEEAMTTLKSSNVDFKSIAGMA